MNSEECEKYIDEIISLDITIANFVLPRIKCLKQHSDSFPSGMSKEEWHQILEKIIFTLEKISNEEHLPFSNNEIKEGCELFGKYFTSLWD